MAEPSSTSLPSFIQTLSDPRRLRLMTLLAQEPRSAAALAEAAGISPAEADKALRRLRDADLVTGDADRYAANEDGLRAAAAALADVIPADGDAPTDGVAFEVALAALQLLNRPQALAVIAALGRGANSAPEVAASAGLPLPAAEDMLARLQNLGLADVSGTPGAYTYELRAAWLRNLPLALEHVAPPSAGASVATSPAEDFEQKTLRDFVVNGRLKTIPSQEKKREVVLRYLAGLFEPQREYPEREVNAILRDVYPDAASLRRYLVDSHLMQRDHGVYWRTLP